MWANWGKKKKKKKFCTFGTTQVINIKLVSLKSNKKDICKYIKSDSQLLIYKITLDYLTILFILSTHTHTSMFNIHNLIYTQTGKKEQSEAEEDSSTEQKARQVYCFEK